MPLPLPSNPTLKKAQLTLTLLTWGIWRAPNNASKWQMGFNSVFKGLNNAQNTPLQDNHDKSLSHKLFRLFRPIPSPVKIKGTKKMAFTLIRYEAFD